jgi:hypothetical protein
VKRRGNCLHDEANLRGAAVTAQRNSESVATALFV